MDNIPAFPSNIANDSQSGALGIGLNAGMTLRDYFAIHASEKEIDGFIPIHNSGETLEIICRTRYKYADAMLAERERKEAKGG